MKSMASFASRFNMIRFSIASYHESRGHNMKFMQAVKPIQSQMAELVSIKSDLKDGLNKLEIDIGDVIKNLFKESVLFVFCFVCFFLCVCFFFLSVFCIFFFGLWFYACFCNLQRNY